MVVIGGVFAPIWLWYLVFSCLVATWPTWIAHRKGYNYLWWWILGSLCFPLELVLAIRAPNSPYRPRRCPSCGDPVPIAAVTCPACETPVPLPPAPSPPAPTPAGRLIDAARGVLYRQ